MQTNTIYVPMLGSKFLKFAITSLILCCIQLRNQTNALADTSKQIKEIPTSTSTSIRANNPYLNFTVNYTEFQSLIRRVTHVPPPLGCSVPINGIAFVYLNHHLFRLYLLQRESMAVRGLAARECLDSRFITICLDDACMEKCKTQKVPHYLRLQVPEVPKSAFGESNVSAQQGYNFMTWLKHELLFAALMATDRVFYFDVDVLILRNPWIEVNKGRNNDGKVIHAEYDVMYQRERGMRERGCGGSVNSGVVYMSNSTAVHEVYKPRMMQARESIVMGTAGRLDQDVMGDYVGLLRYCTFPVSRFAGHCESSREPGGTMNDLVTYHANCVSGTHKYENLRRVVTGALSNKQVL